MDAYTTRDVTFIVFHFFTAAALQVATQAHRLSLLLTLLGAALVALVVTEWTPTVFSVIVLPFFVGSLPGTLLGEFIVSVFDRFRSYHASATSDALEETGRGLGCIRVVDAPRFAPATLIAGTFVATILFTLPVAVSADAFTWVLFLHAGLTFAIYGGAAFAVRAASEAYARAWLILGALVLVNYVILFSFVAFTTLFWSLLVYTTCIVLDAIVVLAIAPCTSGDVQGALSSLSSTFGRHTDAPVTTAAPVAPSYTPMARPNYTVTGSGVTLASVSSSAPVSIPMPKSDVYEMTAEPPHAQPPTPNFFEIFSARS